MYIFCHKKKMHKKIYSNGLLAIMTLSISFNYCCTVTQHNERQDHHFSRNLNINTLNSSSSPPTEQPVYATSNTLSPPSLAAASLPENTQINSINLNHNNSNEMKFIEKKNNLMHQLSANKTALFKSIIKKRDIITYNNDIDNNKNPYWENAKLESRSLHIENLFSTVSPNSAVDLKKFTIKNIHHNNFSEIYATTVINETMHSQSPNFSNENYIDDNNYTKEPYELCDENEDENCVIDHDKVCVGDPQYCNLTRDQYLELLHEYITPTTSEWILIVSHSVVFIMGLVGNALVCIAVYTNHSMRTVTNIFIVNLAVADFFVILFCLPPTVLWDVTETWFFGEAMCKIVIYFQTVSVTVSVLTLTFISMDRWYAICFPLRYKPKPERAWRTLGIIWIIAFLSDIPEFLVLRTKQRIKLRFGSKLFTQCAAEWKIEDERTYNIVKLVLLYVVPLIIMAIAYFQIVRVLWRSDTIPGHRESRNHQSCGLHSTGRVGLNYHSNPTTMGQLRARRKAAKMLVAVVLLFASCYFPVHALNVTRYATNMEQNEVISVLSLLSHWLCYANSACNPVIYNFMSGKYKHAFFFALMVVRHLFCYLKTSLLIFINMALNIDGF
uniref:CSON012390 protein n=1 Tax=Culicoides sonorensis TaxID=179676 RepID=A0A336M9M0_CULSO